MTAVEKWDGDFTTTYAWAQLVRENEKQDKQQVHRSLHCFLCQTKPIDLTQESEAVGFFDRFRRLVVKETVLNLKT